MPSRRYQPASILGHEAEIRQLVAAFLREVAGHPDYHAGNAVHDCVVYVMANKRPGTPRVDGSVIQPILLEQVSRIRQLRSAPTLFPRAHTASAPPDRQAVRGRRKLSHRIRAAWNQLIS